MKVVRIEKIELTPDEAELLIKAKHLMKTLEKESETGNKIWDLATRAFCSLSTLLEDGYSYTAN